MIEVPVFAVIGGGDDGVFYVHQLRQAAAHGRLACSRVLVIDRRADCKLGALLASREPVAAGPSLELIVSDWGEWLADGLDSLPRGSHLVPWHWAPHLLLAWLQLQVERAGGRLQREGEVPPRSLPYDRETREGDRALSYATWACPPTCTEPALCPHTRGPRDWSLAAELASPRPNDSFDGSIAFRCLHLVWGVGTIPVDEILLARDRLVAANHEPECGADRSLPDASLPDASLPDASLPDASLPDASLPDPSLPDPSRSVTTSSGASRWLVSTASHCHGLSASVRLDRGPALSR